MRSASLEATADGRARQKDIVANAEQSRTGEGFMHTDHEIAEAVDKGLSDDRAAQIRADVALVQELAYYGFEGAGVRGVPGRAAAGDRADPEGHAP